MNNKFIPSSLKLIGLVSAMSLAALPLSSKPAYAQTPLIISVDGYLNEYSPSNAPLLRRGIVSSTVQDVQILYFYSPFSG